MKSSLMNMVVVLLCITAVTSAAVGLVYHVTQNPIAQAKAQKKIDALSQVLPKFDNQPVDQMSVVDVDGEDVFVYTAQMGDKVVGYAVESVTNAGFSGVIRIMVGFDAAGNIINIEVLEQAETPGLGAKITEANNPVKVSFVGKNPLNIKMSVRKDGGDIDAITASTISSRAYVGAVSRAYTAFLQASGVKADGWDAASGATSAVKEENLDGGVAEVGVVTEKIEPTLQSSDSLDGNKNAINGVSSTTKDSATGATSRVKTDGSAELDD